MSYNPPGGTYVGSSNSPVPGSGASLSVGSPSSNRKAINTADKKNKRGKGSVDNFLDMRTPSYRGGMGSNTGGGGSGAGSNKGDGRDGNGKIGGNTGGGVDVGGNTGGGGSGGGSVGYNQYVRSLNKVVSEKNKKKRRS